MTFHDPGARARPFRTGVYDLAATKGWVSVGIDHDTATFAVQTIRRWWQDMGAPRYRERRQLLITADGGGSNGAAARSVGSGSCKSWPTTLG